MKKKANIYDADDVERSKRLNFTPEERAARAEHKAEVLGTKLEKAKKKVPKKKKLRLQKELDPEKSKLKHTLRFEEVEKNEGRKPAEKGGQAHGTECPAPPSTPRFTVEKKTWVRKPPIGQSLRLRGPLLSPAMKSASTGRTPRISVWRSWKPRSTGRMSVPLIVPLSGITRNCRKTPSSVLFRNSASSTSMPKSFGKQSRLRNRVQLLFRKQRICLAASVRPWRLRCRSP